MSAPSADRLLSESRPDQPRRLLSRETRVELGLACVVLATTVACALAGFGDRAFEPATFAALVIAYAVAARSALYVGGGCAMPTQIVLVPMLFLLPLWLVPAAVLCACLLASIRSHPPLTAVGDSGYVVAPVAVLAAAGSPSAEAAALWVVALACLAQWTLDAVLSVSREWLGRGIRPTAQLAVMGRVWAVDAVLVPVGLVAVHHPAAALGVVVLLAAVTRDRNQRLVEALERLEELEAERARVRAAVGRLGRSVGATLDRRTMLEVVLGAALDATAAPAGHVTLGPIVHEAGEFTVRTRRLLAEAEAAGRKAGGPARIEIGGWVAVVQPMASGSLAVAGPSISEDDERMLAYLAAQAVASLQTIELHERLRHEATVDELTGLANHRQFQEMLIKEIAHAGRAGLPLSLVLVDVDDFKRVNDTHGHQCGDEVLRGVGAVLRERRRASDTAARYGGEELAVIMPGADAAGACALAEELRAAIAALPGPVPVTASFGVAELGPATGDPTTLVAAADGALYAAKRRGKNRVVAFNRSVDPV